MLFSKLRQSQQRCTLCHSKVLPNFSNDIISNEHLDESYYFNSKNFDEIHENIKRRQLSDLDQLLTSCKKNVKKIEQVLRENIVRLPNQLSPTWQLSLAADEELLKEHNSAPEPGQNLNFRPKTAQKLLKGNKLLVAGREYSLSHTSSNRCFVMEGDLARLEKALLSWTKDQLVQKFNFIPIVVPNLVYDPVIRACGFEPLGQRTQVFTLKGSSSSRQVCLSGTSEIPLVALHLGQLIENGDLPKKLCAVSRCYRAELGSGSSGLYRVNYFNKVEMVAITRKGESAQVLEEIVDIQRYLFSQLGLKFRVRDMPPHDLGLPAHRKFDIEAYFPSSKIWGEISSASDCTDYQSRRFNIKYRHFDPDGEELVRDEFVSSVNGTACASPRILLPLVEENQTEGGRIRIPEVLRDRMNGQTYLNKGAM